MDNELIEVFQFSLQVSDANQTLNLVFPMNKNIRVVTGILITADIEEVIYYRGKQRIEIGGKEIFPAKYETKLLMTSLNISPNDKFFDLVGVKPGDGNLKIAYTDVANPRFNLIACTVSVYIKSEIE